MRGNQGANAFGGAKSNTGFSLPREVAQMDLPMIIKELNTTGLAHLKLNDKVFALSLIEKAKIYTPTAKQEYWIRKLYARALGLEEDAPKLFSFKILGWDKVVALFEEAKKNIKYPEIKLMTPSKLSITLKPSYQGGGLGAVNITDGNPFGSNVWFGKVMKDGEYIPSMKIPSDLADEVQVFLGGFAQDPAKGIVNFGKMTNRCSFCKKKLTDPQSVSAGFGPVCAENYGLFNVWKNYASLEWNAG